MKKGIIYLTVVTLFLVGGCASYIAPLHSSSNAYIIGSTPKKNRKVVIRKIDDVPIISRGKRLSGFYYDTEPDDIFEITEGRHTVDVEYTDGFWVLTDAITFDAKRATAYRAIVTGSSIKRSSPDRYRLAIIERGR